MTSEQDEEIANKFSRLPHHVLEEVLNKLDDIATQQPSSNGWILLAGHAAFAVNTIPHIVELRKDIMSCPDLDKSSKRRGVFSTLMWGPVRHFAEAYRRAAWLVANTSVYRVNSKEVPMRWSSAYFTHQVNAAEKFQQFAWPLQPQVASWQPTQQPAVALPMGEHPQPAVSHIDTPGGKRSLCPSGGSDDALAAISLATPKSKVRRLATCHMSAASWMKHTE